MPLPPQVCLFIIEDLSEEMEFCIHVSVWTLWQLVSCLHLVGSWWPWWLALESCGSLWYRMCRAASFSSTSKLSVPTWPRPSLPSTSSPSCGNGPQKRCCKTRLQSTVRGRQNEDTLWRQHVLLCPIRKKMFLKHFLCPHGTQQCCHVLPLMGSHPLREG